MVLFETVKPVKLGTADAMRIPALPLSDNVDPLITTSATAAVLLKAIPAPPLLTAATFASVILAMLEALCTKIPAPSLIRPVAPVIRMFLMVMRLVVLTPPALSVTTGVLAVADVTIVSTVELVPLPEPTIVNCLLIVKFSTYVPGITWMVSPASAALMADWMVVYSLFGPTTILSVWSTNFRFSTFDSVLLLAGANPGMLTTEIDVAPYVMV